MNVEAECLICLQDQAVLLQICFTWVACLQKISRMGARTTAAYATKTWQIRLASYCAGARGASSSERSYIRQCHSLRWCLPRTAFCAVTTRFMLKHALCLCRGISLFVQRHDECSNLRRSAIKDVALLPNNTVTCGCTDHSCSLTAGGRMHQASDTCNVVASIQLCD